MRKQKSILQKMFNKYSPIFIITISIILSSFFFYHQQQKNSTNHKRKKAQPIYQQAYSLYKKKDYRKALEKFKEVKEALADYKKTPYYIKRLPEDIQRQKERRLKKQATALYREALDLYRAKHYRQAKEKFKQTAQIISGYSRVDHYLKRTSENIEEEKQKVRQKKIKSLFAKVDSLWENQDYEKSQPLLEQILELDKENDQAKEMLSSLPEKIAQREKEKKEAKAPSTYEQALILYRDKNYQAALEKFKQVRDTLSDYKKTQYYLDRTTEDIQRQKKRLRRKKAQPIYQQAYSLYKKKDYRKALEKFKEVNKFYPGYKNTQSYIQNIPKEIKEAKIKEKIADAQYLIKKGDRLLEEKTYQQAYETYRKALLALEEMNAPINAEPTP